MLETKNVTMQFQGLTAVQDFNITVGDNEIVGLIGPNGAGTTTAFNMITGMYTPTKGTILFNG
jgi:branched-chain amino acid transport system ATP-binding protein